MNRIDELKSLINNCKKTIESSEKEIEMLKFKESAFERVKIGEEYYSIGKKVTTGEFISYQLTEGNTPFGEDYFENNNYFLTKERAEEVVNKINFLLKLERLHDIYCPDYKPDWNNMEENKWYATFDSRDKKYTRFWTNVYLEAVVYFDSKETTEKVCEILNEELRDEQTKC